MNEVVKSNTILHRIITQEVHSILKRKYFTVLKFSTYNCRHTVDSDCTVLQQYTIFLESERWIELLKKRHCTSLNKGLPVYLASIFKVCCCAVYMTVRTRELQYLH